MDFQIPEANNDAIIKVVGVGGGGGNAVNHMYHEGIKDVEFMICNTDAQALKNSDIPIRIQLGASLTEGRGAGNKPEIGKEAAKESYDRVKEILSNNTKMVFVTAGMGGGTGTGAAPVIASIARELEILTIGIVTIPFKTEGRKRLNQAIEGIQELKEHVDSLLVINNERIKDLFVDFPISEAFKKADGILATAAKGIAEIITITGFINVDFADVVTVMKDSGVAIMGSATAEGENRAEEAIMEALNSPLLNDNNIRGAKNILVNIYSGEPEATMSELNSITEYVQDSAGYEADLIWGNGQDLNLGEKIRVTVIATGFDESCIPTTDQIQKRPNPRGPKPTPMEPNISPQNNTPQQSHVDSQSNVDSNNWQMPTNQINEGQHPRHNNSNLASQDYSDYKDPMHQMYQQNHLSENPSQIRQEQLRQDYQHQAEDNESYPQTPNSPFKNVPNNEYQNVEVQPRQSSPLADRYENEYNNHRLQRYGHSTNRNIQPNDPSEENRPDFPTISQPLIREEEKNSTQRNFERSERVRSEFNGKEQAVQVDIPPVPNQPIQHTNYNGDYSSSNEFHEGKTVRDNMKRNFQTATEEELDEFESVPAYKRKNRKSFMRDRSERPVNKPTDVSPQINSTNSYLHDNVD